MRGSGRDQHLPHFLALQRGARAGSGCSAPAKLSADPGAQPGFAGTAAAPVIHHATWSYETIPGTPRKTTILKHEGEERNLVALSCSGAGKSHLLPVAPAGSPGVRLRPSSGSSRAALRAVPRGLAPSQRFLSFRFARTSPSQQPPLTATPLRDRAPPAERGGGWSPRGKEGRERSGTEFVCQRS